MVQAGCKNEAPDQEGAWDVGRVDPGLGSNIVHEAERWVERGNGGCFPEGNFFKERHGGVVRCVSGRFAILWGELVAAARARGSVGAVPWGARAGFGGGDGLAVLTLTPRGPLVHAPPGGAGLSALVSRVRGGLRRSR